MKEVQKILKQAEFVTAKRRNLTQEIGKVSERYIYEENALKAANASIISRLMEEKKAALSNIEARAQKDISEYAQIKNDLERHMCSVKKWCPKQKLETYSPNPARIEEVEVTRLLKMLNEQGIIAWIKRTFKLDGYTSREEMALLLCKKLEDACAYCCEKIAAYEANKEAEKSAVITEYRRKEDNANNALNRRIEDLTLHQKEEKEQASAAVGKFDASSELRDIHIRIEQMKKDAENAYGSWGEYVVASTMPERLYLCNAKVDLPNVNGLVNSYEVPLWLDLQESNMLVITTREASVKKTDSKEKEFARKLLTRMLKSIPSKCCNYSVFDTLHNGTSLGRLIDITNIGTTDLHFDLFTSNEPDANTITCAERRKYLRRRLAEIIRHIAGNSSTLYEYNKEAEEFEYPFTWYIDFNFPDNPDTKHMEDLKELFINAQIAGYSFVFVTTESGYNKIVEIAESNTNIPILHIDVDSAMCEKNGFRVNYLNTGAPENTQISNFTAALKNHYEVGSILNNRIDQVFTNNRIELRDASKKLAIPMALDSRGKVIDLELGGDGGTHAFISGTTGCGKTTLLNSIILSACLHYRPDDLELWLADYKLTEFYLYKKNTPPHIKLLGVSKTEEFTYNFIDKMMEEQERRSLLFQKFNATSLSGYRQHQGETGYVNLPRVLIVIDEFHEMSQICSGNDEYKNKLEKILREVRTVGINCLLADQTFSKGLAGLTPAAKDQIAHRIAMKNSASEIKDTLEVDRALYSDNMTKMINLLIPGDFLMKTFVRNKHGEVIDAKVEKLRAFRTIDTDLSDIGRTLRKIYAGQYMDDLVYVNTKEVACWNNNELDAMDELIPLKKPNIRLYLGRSASLKPCFNLDLGRKMNENLSIVGGTAEQRWELITSIMRSCNRHSYRLIVFMAEYCDLMNEYEDVIREFCQSHPSVELVETMEEWLDALYKLEQIIDTKQGTEDIICLFMGLELQYLEFDRMQQENGHTKSLQSIAKNISRYGASTESVCTSLSSSQSYPDDIDANAIIKKICSYGARNGIRCIVEASVYREYKKMLGIAEMCKHKIAFDMSADDCLMYLGNSNFQKKIAGNAIYNDGSKDVKLLFPYKLI